MTTGLTYLGQNSLGEIVPIALAASASLKVVIGLNLPKLTAQLDGLLSLSASISIKPPSLVANLDLAVNLLASLTASLALGLPSIDFQFAAVASLIAGIQLDLAALQAALVFQVSLDAALLNAGVNLYAYDGAVNAFGPAITSQFSAGLPQGTPPEGHCNALLLVAETPTVWASMSAVLKTG